MKSVLLERYVSDGARLHRRSSSDAIAGAQTWSVSGALTARQLLLGLLLKVKCGVCSQGWQAEPPLAAALPGNLMMNAESSFFNETAVISTL